MESLQSPVKRFMKRLLLALSILFVLNILLSGFYVFRHIKSASEEMLPIPLLKQLSRTLVADGNCFKIDSVTINQLQSQHLWAMLLDDRQGTILWSYKLPRELPQKYTLSDIAFLSRYYLKDYPVYTWKHTSGLIVLGFPKGSWTKVIGAVPVSEANSMLWNVLLIVCADLLILFLIYFIINRKTLRSVTNILSGIRSLANGKLIQLEEKGFLSEIAIQLNRTSDLLKNHFVAQENWIAGVSHDIRTPLSVILGYAEQIEQNKVLPDEVREKASTMKCHGVKLRNLVNDLNLITRLGDRTITLQQEYFHPAIFSRTMLANFLNDVSNENYPIKIDIEKKTETLFLLGNPHLLQRAIANLLYNSVHHNPNGCEICFSLRLVDNIVAFVVSDNGKGLPIEQFKKLQNRSHHLSYNDSTLLQQHGLGLYIVQQIVKLHHGKVSFSNNISGGIQVTIAMSTAEKT